MTEQDRTHAMARAKPSMLPVYAACVGIAAAIVGAIVAAGYLLR
jgi:hypothetical protein